MSARTGITIRTLLAMAVLSAASTGAGAAADLTISSAAITSGKLVVTGATSLARATLTLDGKYTTTSTASKAFTFSLSYLPADCVVAVARNGSSAAPVQAAVENCAVPGLTPRGAWSAATAYQLGDIVTQLGSSWFAKTDNTGKSPSATPSAWLQLVAKGASGAAGATGPKGPAGATGSAGSQGPSGAQGPAGPQGIVGPQGDAGPQGNAGANAADGAQGPQGAAGMDGAVEFFSVTTTLNDYSDVPATAADVAADFAKNTTFATATLGAHDLIFMSGIRPVPSNKIAHTGTSAGLPFPFSFYLCGSGGTPNRVRIEEQWLNNDDAIPLVHGADGLTTTIVANPVAIFGVRGNTPYLTAGTWNFGVCIEDTTAETSIFPDGRSSYHLTGPVEVGFNVWIVHSAQ